MSDTAKIAIAVMSFLVINTATAIAVDRLVRKYEEPPATTPRHPGACYCIVPCNQPEIVQL